MSKNSINIIVDIQNISYTQLLNEIENHLLERKQLLVTYCNAHTFNLCYQSPENQKIYEEFNIVHPDGFGVFFASKFLYGSKGFKNQLTGSTFYQLLLEEGIKKKWKFFFFGDKKETLKRISSVNPELKTAGYHNGYEFDNDKVTDMINNANPDILIVGMGLPKQEKWMLNSKQNLNPKVIIAVGRGLYTITETKDLNVLNNHFYVPIKKYCKDYRDFYEDDVFIHSSEFNCKVFPIPPLYTWTAFSNYEKEFVKDQFERVAVELKKRKGRYKKLKFVEVDDPNSYLQELTGNAEIYDIALDTETTGLNFKRDKIFCITLSYDGETGYYLDYNKLDKVILNDFFKADKNFI